MSKSENTTRYTAQAIKKLVRQGKSRTNRRKIHAMTAKDIQRARKNDPDAAISPMPGDWDNLVVSMTKPKEPLYMRVDADVLNWFRKYGKGYQTTINAVLRSYMQSHQDRV